MSEEKRKLVQMGLRISAKKLADEFCEKRGTSLIAMTSRLVEWFVVQPEELQLLILEQVHEPLKGDIMRIAIERFTTPTPPVEVEDEKERVEGESELDKDQGEKKRRKRKPS